MKVLRFIAAALALTLVACGPDDNNEGNGPQTDNFKVVASTYTIAADGVDAVEFTATLNGEALAADKVEAFVNDAKTQLPNMKFSTNEAGSYTIYFTYGELRSETFLIEAVNVGGLDLSPNNEEGLTLRATTTAFQIGVDEVLIIVRYKGEVIDPSKVTFYDLANNSELTFESKDVTDINGDSYKLAIYTADEVGTRSIWAARNSGPGDSREKPVTITAVDFAIPARAIDPQPENTSFNKRMFITQFTGTECGYCPFFIAALKRLTEDDEYSNKFVLAAVHSYNSHDPMYPVENGDIDQTFGVSSYPTVICDMKYSLNNNGFQTNLNQLKNRINTSLSEDAKVGISAKIANDEGNIVVARVTVKAAEEGEYRIGAWLVEDGVYAMQYNNGCKEYSSEEFSTHEAAVRIADSKPEGESHYAGHSLGKLAAGEIADKVFVMELKQDAATDNAKLHWVKENCRLVFFVTVQTNDGTYVTNVVQNDNLTQTITFDYK